MKDYLPSTENNVNEMFSELKKIAGSIKQPYLLKLLKPFPSATRISAGISVRHLAAVQYHHAFLGGVLEHTLSVAKLGEKIAPLYPDLNKDLFNLRNNTYTILAR